MTQAAYERMYGKPADIDKVWEDRDELHELTWKAELEDWYKQSIRSRLGRRNARRYFTSPMWWRVENETSIWVSHQQRRRRQRVTILGALLAVLYLMYRMVS